MSVAWIGPDWLKRPADALGLRYYYRPTHLSLRGPAYCDAVVEHLVQLQDLKQLELESTQISAAGMARLRKALPICRIDGR